MNSLKLVFSKFTCLSPFNIWIQRLNFLVVLMIIWIKKNYLDCKSIWKRLEDLLRKIQILNYHKADSTYNEIGNLSSHSSQAFNMCVILKKLNLYIFYLLFDTNHGHCWNHRKTATTVYRALFRKILVRPRPCRLTYIAMLSALWTNKTLNEMRLHRNMCHIVHWAHCIVFF